MGVPIESLLAVGASAGRMAHTALVMFEMVHGG